MNSTTPALLSTFLPKVNPFVICSRARPAYSIPAYRALNRLPGSASASTPYRTHSSSIDLHPYAPKSQSNWLDFKSKSQILIDAPISASDLDLRIRMLQIQARVGHNPRAKSPITIAARSFCTVPPPKLESEPKPDPFSRCPLSKHIPSKYMKWLVRIYIAKMTFRAAVWVVIGVYLCLFPFTYWALGVDPVIGLVLLVLTLIFAISNEKTKYKPAIDNKSE